MLRRSRAERISHGDREIPESEQRTITLKKTLDGLDGVKDRPQPSSQVCSTPSGELSFSMLSWFFN
jgi:hypothetical protein